MAMSVVYGNFCGMLAGENRGGTKSDYVADTLGSLATVLDDTGAAVYTAEYWPYGEVRTETGANPSTWSFAGLLGYFYDILSKLLYVRARIMTPGTGQWLSVDPIWPLERPYSYLGGRPVSEPDPSGLGVNWEDIVGWVLFPVPKAIYRCYKHFHGDGNGDKKKNCCEGVNQGGTVYASCYFLCNQVWSGGNVAEGRYAECYACCIEIGSKDLGRCTRDCLKPKPELPCDCPKDC